MKLTILQLSACLLLAGFHRAAALVPPLVASCTIPGVEGCVPLNSYDCDDRHGKWTTEPCPPPKPPSGTKP